MSNISVIIPIYKVLPNYYEKQSLCKCLKILRNYQIVLVHPEGLDLSFYKKIIKRHEPNFVFAAFNSEFFVNITGYNKLLTSLLFYKFFSENDYILIYQLDAFIFKDELAHWSNQKYACIGAPIPNHILDYLNKKHIEDFNTPLDIKGCFMNGGFSLRNVESYSDLIQHNLRKINLYINKEWSEDVIFALLLQDSNFKLPLEDEAIKFSFESFPAFSFEKNSQRLPTGCHAWYRDEFSIHDKMFWFKRIIPLTYYKFLIQEKTMAILSKNIRRIERFINRFNTND